MAEAIIDGTGEGNALKVDNDNAAYVKNVSALVTEKYDAIIVTTPTTIQEVYTYKTGGATGTTVAIITVNYTTSAKDLIASVVKT